MASSSLAGVATLSSVATAVFGAGRGGAGGLATVGTVEYNLALGEQRARAAKEYLVHMGISPNRIAIASFGSQRPKYPGHDETAHAKNRRDDLLVH